MARLGILKHFGEKKNTNLHPLLNTEAARPTERDCSGHAAMELKLWKKTVKVSSRAETLSFRRDS